jgi:uncharacterized protein YraI
MKLARLTLCAGAFAILSTYAVAKPAYVLTNLNMRSGPATTNDIVVRIPAGSLVEVNACTTGWCEVSWQGKNGFSIETGLDLSGRVPQRRYSAGPAYGPGYGPPVYSAPPVYYGPPTYYYGPSPYYYRPWRRRYYY